MLESILANGAVGALTGYFTNAVALRMLFRSYLGIGGVIPKEYQKFKEGIGELIEKYLVNPENLAPYLTSRKFHLAVERGVQRWIEEGLPELLKVGEEPLRLRDLPGGRKLVGEIIKTLRGKQEQLLFPLADWYLQKPLQLFISEEQFQAFKRGLEEQLRGGQWEHYLRRLGVDQWQLGELFSDRFWEEVERGITQLLVEEPSEEWKRELREQFRPLIEELIGEWEEGLLDRPLGELLPIVPSEGARRLGREIGEFLDSPEGERLVEELGEEVLHYLKGVRRGVGELIGEEGLHRVQEWVRWGVPLILREFQREIDRDRERLERIIDRDLKGLLPDNWLVATIVEILLGNIASKFRIVETIQRKLEEFGERGPEEIGKEAAEFLRQKRIGEIFQKLEEEGLITPQLIGRLLQLNIQELLKKRPQLLEPIVRELLQKTPRQLGLTQLEFLVEPLLQQLPSLFWEQLRQGVSLEQERIIQELRQQAVGGYLSLIPYRQGLALLEEWYYQVAPKPLRRYISPTKLVSRPIPLYPLVHWLEGFPINQLLPALQNRETYHSVASLLIDRLMEELPTLLKGRVKELVVQELEPLKPDEVGEMAYNFFGKEMKPITLFGGVLGLGVGAGLGGVVGGSGGIAPLVYGLTGIGTNYLAIEMLFKPYTPKSYLPGLSPGVLVKKRRELANHISQFVSKELLTESSIQRKFRQLEEEIGAQLIEDFSREEYRQIRHWIGEHLKEEAPVLARQLVTTIVSNRQWVARELARLVVDRWVEIAPQLLPFLQLKGTQLLSDPEVGRGIGVHLKRAIGEVEGERVLAQMEPMLSREIEKWFLQLKGQLPQLIEGAFHRWGPQLERLGRLSPLELGIVTPRELQESRDRLVIELVYRLQREEGLLEQWRQRLEQELKGDKERKIGELFNGAVGKWFRDQIDFIIEEALRQLLKYREELVELVLDRIPTMGRALLRPQVEEGVDILLRKSLPTYLKGKREFLQQLLDRYFLSQPVEVLKLQISPDRLYPLWEQFWGDRQIQRQLGRVIERLEFHLLSQPLYRLLSLGNLPGVKGALQQLMPVVEEGVSRWFEEHQTSLQYRTQRGVLSYFQERLKGRRVGEFLAGVKWEEEGKGVQRALYRKWKEGLRRQVMEVVWEVIVRIPPDREVLARDLEGVLAQLEEGYSKVEMDLQPLLKELGQEFPNRIPSTTLQWGVELGVKSGLIHFQRELPRLIEAVELPKVIGEAFLKLPPAELEGMFRGFAQPYFNRLILYGGFGALFSLPLLLL